MSDDNKEPILDRTNYPGNSYKAKKDVAAPAGSEEESIADPSKRVTTGEVRREKKTFWGKFKEVIIGDDAQNVGSYILFDIAVPAFKNFIYDSLTQGAEQTLFGRNSRGGGSSRNNRSGSGSNYTSYNKVYGNSSNRAREEDPYDRHVDRRSRANHDFENIVIENRGEAEAVLDQLCFMIDEYDVAKVANFYDAVGITPSFQDNKWGWTNLSTASVRRARGGGYILNLPRPEAV